jgi:hypothetical protein
LPRFVPSPRSSHTRDWLGNQYNRPCPTLSVSPFCHRLNPLHLARASHPSRHSVSNRDQTFSSRSKQYSPSPSRPHSLRRACQREITRHEHTRVDSIPVRGRTLISGRADGKWLNLERLHVRRAKEVALCALQGLVDATGTLDGFCGSKQLAGLDSVSDTTRFHHGPRETRLLSCEQCLPYNFPNCADNNGCRLYIVALASTSSIDNPP